MTIYPVKVSVCIPCYRQADKLRRLIDSVLLQTFSNYEIVISDDSPDDVTEALVREFGVDSHIRYTRNVTALGSPANWNNTIRLARGEFIKIMHHDDWFATPHALGRLVNALDTAPDAVMAFCASDNRVSSHITQSVHRAGVSQLAALAADPSVLFGGNFIGAPSAVIHRRRDSVMYDEALRWFVDIDFYMRLLAGSRAIYVDDPLVCITIGGPERVTARCEYSRDVELTEAFHVFAGIVSRGVDPARHREHWYRLFERFGVFQLAGVARYQGAFAVDDDYFQDLFRRLPARLLVRFPWYVGYALKRLLRSKA